MHALHSASAKTFQPVHLGGQIISVDVQMHAGGRLNEALHEQPEILAMQRRAVILGVVEPWKRLAGGCLIERMSSPVLVLTDPAGTDAIPQRQAAQPPKKRHRACASLSIAAAVVALGVILGVALGGGSQSGNSKSCSGSGSGTTASTTTTCCAHTWRQQPSR
jgi:hypothetical protein